MITVVRRRPGRRPVEHPVLRPHRLAVGGYDLVGRPAAARSHGVELDVAGARTDGARAGRRAPRPRCCCVNDDDLAYAKIRLDEASLDDGGRAPAATSTETLPRALVLAAAWDMTRDGELGARDFVDLVLARRRRGGRLQRRADPAAPAARARSPSTSLPSTARRPGPAPPTPCRACSSGGAGQRPAAASSPGRSPRTRYAGAGRRTCAGLLGGTRPSRAWPSTPTCGGPC